QNFKAGLSFHYSKYSNSALNFANSIDPRPDYYRKLPSYLNDNHYFLDEDGNQQLDESTIYPQTQEELTQLWSDRNQQTTQINFDRLAQSNLANNINPDSIYRVGNLYYSNGKYMLLRRHNNLMETAFNANYKNQLNDKLKLTAGVEAKQSKGIHFATVDDLLGADHWLDIDVFADRDLTGGLLPENSHDVIQNNIGKYPVSYEGDKINYDYDLNTYHIAAYLQNDWNFRNVELYYALQGTYTTFNRFGRMLNGRALFLHNQYLERIYNNGLKYSAEDDVNSLGKSVAKTFIDPAFKAGVTWKINGRNIIQANVMAETQAPLANNAFVSQRIKDTYVKNLVSEKIISGDIAYNFSFPKVFGRVSAFYTKMFDALETAGYYDDEYRTFINCAMSGVDKQYYGVEAGVQVKLDKNFSLALAGTYSDYSYTDNAKLSMSAENGSDITGQDYLGDGIDVETQAMIKGLHVAAGPQIAASLALKYFHPKMWFADITINYFDKNYFNFAPSHYRADYFGTFDRSYYNNPKNMNELKAMTNTELKQWISEQDWGMYGADVPVPGWEYLEDGDMLYRMDKSAARKVLGEQEKINSGWNNWEQISSHFLVDLSVGKLIYLPKRQSLSINLSVNNILNSRVISGGYQQGRVPMTKFRENPSKLSTNYDKYPSKYYYANGLNFYLSIGYRF
ncbi:MAG: hypothetical protein LBN95_06415, partial [Prevotellaceae bacterium]|nr:hypothetical protein [Prevotellaceae bacterium]